MRGEDHAAPRVKGLKAVAVAKRRQIPRKKLSRVELDLDGDGSVEVMVYRQRQPDPDWKGQDKSKGPHFVAEVRSKSAPASAKPRWSIRRYGWAQGWAQIGVKTTAGQSIGLFFWAVPEDNDSHVSFLFLPKQGQGIFGDFGRTPLSAVDLNGDGGEELIAISQELYQDYFKTGTMELLQWQPSHQFVPSFKAAPFEFCLTSDAKGNPLVVQVTADQKRIELLEPLEASRVTWRSLNRHKVTPAKQGPNFSVPTGFALSCTASPGRVQFATKYFDVRTRRFVLVTP
ncbi:MAG TPA: hypothetical protein DCQ06_13645 [Myxococcales bacterium]|nr:hypothetical protein [Myxococcales bacterium]